MNGDAPENGTFYSHFLLLNGYAPEKSPIIGLFVHFYRLLWTNGHQKGASLPLLGAGCTSGMLNGDAPEYVQYFLRGHFDFKLCLGCINYDRDPQFSTCYDHKVAMILCNEMLRIYVNKKLHSLERIEQIEKSRKDLPVHPFTWTDPKNAAVELGYAIYAKGTLNNGNVDIKEIMTYLESSFNIDLGDYYRTYLSLKGRKRGQTLFLDSLKEALIKKMNDDDRL